MRVKNQERYENWKKSNVDPYGKGIFAFAEAWANLMERDIENGAKLVDIAAKLSNDADAEGITGFMYGAAVSILSECWIYGEDLRRWHNKDYGYVGNGVVNPAVITIGKQKEASERIHSNA